MVIWRYDLASLIAVHVLSVQPLVKKNRDLTQSFPDL